MKKEAEECEELGIRRAEIDRETQQWEERAARVEEEKVSCQATFVPNYLLYH